MVNTVSGVCKLSFVKLVGVDCCAGCCENSRYSFTPKSLSSHSAQYSYYPKRGEAIDVVFHGRSQVPYGKVEQT